MNYRCGIFSVFLWAAIFFSATLLARAADDTVHVVAKGETVFSIARSYQVSQEELMKFNGITDPNKLLVGKRIKIPPAAGSLPGTQASAVLSGGERHDEYKVVKDDTLYGIARAYGTSLQALRELNGFPQDYVQIKPGQIIKVPKKSAPALATGKPDVTAKQDAGNADASLPWPVSPREIAYMTGKAYGVVLLGVQAESVKSLIQGTVIAAIPWRGYGRVAIVEVSGGYRYLYGGCETLSVKEGDKIGPGAELGKLGINAISGKPQLFFLVYKGNTPIDPAKAPRA